MMYGNEIHVRVTFFFIILFTLFFLYFFIF